MEVTCPHCDKPYVLKVAHKLEDGAWLGAPAFVLGGGPSMNDHGALLPSIADHGYVIATNRAIELPVRIDVWTWMEERVFREVSDGRLGPRAQEAFLKYGGAYVARTLRSRNVVYPHYVTQINTEPSVLLGESFSTKVHTHTNVGFFGMNLAYCLGADPIVLLGFDQRGDTENQQTWWHNGYPHHASKDVARTYQVMRTGFEAAARQADAERRRIWNVSSITTLDCFPTFGALGDALAQLETAGITDTTRGK